MINARLLFRWIAAVSCFCCFMSAPAWATYTCTGLVKGLALTPSGDLIAEEIAGINWVCLCRLDGPITSNTGYDTCKSIYAMLLTAQAQAKSVRLWFDDNLTCSTHPPWASLTGWYFGPQLVD